VRRDGLVDRHSSDRAYRSRNESQPPPAATSDILSADSFPEPDYSRGLKEIDLETP
jgi:hypothetical protein